MFNFVNSAVYVGALRGAADVEELFKNNINLLNPRVMEANIKAIHFDISEKLTAFVNKKINKLCNRFEAIDNVDVNLRLVKPETAMNKEAGIKLCIPQSPDLFASKTADTFEEAVDLCLEALEKQLEKNKDKRI